MREFQDTQKLMGDNFCPDGVKADRKELELAKRDTHEQGLGTTCCKNRRMNLRHTGPKRKRVIRTHLPTKG